GSAVALSTGRSDRRGARARSRAAGRSLGVPLAVVGLANRPAAELDSEHCAAGQSALRGDRAEPGEPDAPVGLDAEPGTFGPRERPVDAQVLHRELDPSAVALEPTFCLEHPWAAARVLDPAGELPAGIAPGVDQPAVGDAIVEATLSTDIALGGADRNGHHP